MANKLLVEIDELEHLYNVSVEELMNIKGIGRAKACKILAAIEFGKRLNRISFDKSKMIKLSNASSIYEIYKDEFIYLEQEQFVCIFLNTKNQVIKKKILFIGSLNISVVHVREIYKEAFKCSANSFVCIHNHPSGDPSPSKNDISVTDTIKSSSEIMSIKFLDHIIFGKFGFYSFYEKGYLN